jgi:microcystin-dependent protein
MSEAYLGEIRMFAGGFAPVNWAFCDGSLIPIEQNQALYTLIGTIYGGDGTNTFALPDLRGRAPLHKSSTYPIGSNGGVESVTLTSAQLAAHSHAPMASTAAGTASTPADGVWATSTYASFSTAQAPAATMSAQTVAAVGGGQPHDNMMPFVVISYIICTAGLFPSFN